MVPGDLCHIVEDLPDILVFIRHIELRRSEVGEAGNAEERYAAVARLIGYASQAKCRRNVHIGIELVIAEVAPVITKPEFIGQRRIEDVGFASGKVLGKVDDAAGVAEAPAVEDRTERRRMTGGLI